MMMKTQDQSCASMASKRPAEPPTSLVRPAAPLTSAIRPGAGMGMPEAKTVSMPQRRAGKPKGPRRPTECYPVRV